MENVKKYATEEQRNMLSKLLEMQYAINQCRLKEELKKKVLTQRRAKNLIRKYRQLTIPFNAR